MERKKEKFNLENFPTSESAKKMLSYVTGSFYDESYVGKWIFQVMGVEYDRALEMAVALPEQFFVETATWGLRYHEVKWQLPVREDLPYEERRRRINLKRMFRAPMTPYNMERYLQEITGPEVHVADVHDPGEYGFTAGHPNVFKVYFILGEQTRDLMPVYKTLNSLKQSHTTYSVKFDYHKKIDIKAVASGGMGSIIKIKARVAKSVNANVEHKPVSALFFNQDIIVRADNSVKEGEAYVLGVNGEKVRVTTKNGYIVKVGNQ